MIGMIAYDHWRVFEGHARLNARWVDLSNFLDFIFIWQRFLLAINVATIFIIMLGRIFS